MQINRQELFSHVLGPCIQVPKSWPFISDFLSCRSERLKIKKNIFLLTHLQNCMWAPWLYLSTRCTRGCVTNDPSTQWLTAISIYSTYTRGSLQGRGWLLEANFRLWVGWLWPLAAGKLQVCSKCLCSGAGPAGKQLSRSGTFFSWWNTGWSTGRQAQPFRYVSGVGFCRYHSITRVGYVSKAKVEE